MTHIVVPRRIYVFAPNERTFTRYRNIHFQTGWKWISVIDENTMRGLPRGTPLIWLRGDKRSDYGTDRTKTPMNRIAIRELCYMDLEGRIDIQLRKMEQSP